MPDRFKAAALELLHARTDQEKTRKALQEYREKNGGCENEGADRGDEYPAGICYHDDKDQNTWCETCLGAQPIWEAKRKAANRAGAALRSLLALAKKEEKTTCAS